jgi:hypothetical protein
MTVIIGIDPHKATHTAVAIDGDEQPIARLDVTADRCQTQRLLAWAAPFDERLWAIESAAGLRCCRWHTESHLELPMRPKEAGSVRALTLRRRDQRAL